MLDRRVDGLLLWPAYAVAFSEHFPELANRIVPVGAIEHVFPPELSADRVESDDQHGVDMLVKHLAELGHRRLACLSTREITAQTWAVRRRECFEQASKAQPGVTCKSWRLNRDGDNGVQVARDLLTSPFKPTAVFGVSDHEARLIYQAADELAVRVPEDVSVVGFGNLDFAATLSPGLTTLDRKPAVMGRLLGELLIARLSHPEQTASTVQVDVEMITRGSTGPAVEYSEA
ncbi:MAG: substrate-binding domain-containing protein [Planctomycetota bacterium]